MPRVQHLSVDKAQPLDNQRVWVTDGNAIRWETLRFTYRHGREPARGEEEQPNMKRGPWDSDWYQYIYQTLAKQGLQTLTEFCELDPTAPYKKLAKALGPHIAPAQIEIILKREAIENFQFARFARGSLVRYLHKHIPEGWRRSGQSDIQRAAAYASWASALGTHYSESVQKLRTRFQKMEIPVGWLPDGPDDPIIRALFRGIPFHYEETG